MLSPADEAAIKAAVDLPIDESGPALKAVGKELVEIREVISAKDFIQHPLVKEWAKKFFWDENGNRVKR